MAGTACFMPRNTPFALMLMSVSHAAVLRVSGSWEPLMPALFTSTSSRPYAPTMVRTASCQSSSLATSSFTNCALPPSPLIFVATARPSASITSATTTIAPSRANRTASHSPMPWAAPLIIATFPLSLMVSSAPRVHSRSGDQAVRLVDEPHHPQAIMHAHRWRLAAAPVFDDLAHGPRVEGFGRLGRECLLAGGRDEPPRVVVIVHEHRIAAGDLPLAVP